MDYLCMNASFPYQYGYFISFIMQLSDKGYRLVGMTHKVIANRECVRWFGRRTELRFVFILSTVAIILTF